MRRSAVLPVALYAALVVSLATPLYLPLASGRDDSWALLVLVAAAHVGLGAASGRRWVLWLPVAVSIVAFLAAGAEGLAWQVLLLGMPALVAVTAAGLALGRFAGGRRGALATGCSIVALAPAAWAAVEVARRGPPAPGPVERRLPIDLSLGNLCPGAETPPGVARDVRRRAEALIRELRRRPSELVTYTYHSSHEDDERRRITIRELAEEQLKELESSGLRCAPDLERRLRDAM